MKRTIAAILSAAAVAATFTLSACNKGDDGLWKGASFSSMNNTAQLVLKLDGTEESAENFNNLCNETKELLTALDNSLSATKGTSYISLFNEAAAGAEVEIDKTAYDVLTLAKSVYELTEGYYNPAVYYNVQAFGFNGAESFPQTAEELPKDETIEKYNELSAQFENLQLKAENGRYYAVKPAKTVEIDGTTYSMKIDLGGIGKGYAVDKVNELIDGYGFKYGYFNFASSSIALKTYSEKEGYNLSFTNARDFFRGAYGSTTVLNNCVSTSGDYEQYYMIEDTRYCHVFSPKTGKPVQTGIMTATIIGGSAAEDDALTTALMAMGKENAVQFINENLSGRRVIMSLELDGGGYGVITNMPKGTYQITVNNFTVLNTVDGDGKIVLG